MDEGRCECVGEGAVVVVVVVVVEASAPKVYPSSQCRLLAGRLEGGWFGGTSRGVRGCQFAFWKHLSLSLGCPGVTIAASPWRPRQPSSRGNKCNRSGTHPTGVVVAEKSVLLL